MTPDLLIEAFDEVCNEYSADRVVADPEMNSAFLRACRTKGLTNPIAELNKSLLNARKAGKLSGRPRSKTTSFSDQSEYGFAAEMAIRFMERKHSLSLDVVICDPELATEFDELAASICPGQSKLQYRWAALSLRKKGGLEPEIGARVLAPEAVLSFRAQQFSPDEIPRRQGLYLISSSEQLLYVG
jgi:site-specific DNA-methyltransferase (adenine-specific)